MINQFKSVHLSKKEPKIEVVKADLFDVAERKSDTVSFHTPPKKSEAPQIQIVQAISQEGSKEEAKARMGAVETTKHNSSKKNYQFNSIMETTRESSPTSTDVRFPQWKRRQTMAVDKPKLLLLSPRKPDDNKKTTRPTSTKNSAAAGHVLCIDDLERGGEILPFERSKVK